MAATNTTQPVDVNPEELLRPWPRVRFRSVVMIAIFALVYVWGLTGVKVSISEFVSGIPNIIAFLGRLLPPAWKTVESPVATPELALPFGLTIPSVGVGVSVAVPEIVFAIIETIQMAIVGTSIAIFFSLPFSLLAARNTSPHRWIYQSTRLVLNMIRAIPEIIIALMFVAAVGLGPFSGVLAISVGAVGYMAKLYAEAIESIDSQQVLAVSATGASRTQTFVYGVIPQALPLMASYSLLVFEANVRTATVLGIVGAGGVGFVLSKYMALFQYQYLMGAVILLLLATTAIDRTSDSIRRRLQ